MGHPPLVVQAGKASATRWELSSTHGIELGWTGGDARLSTSKKAPLLRAGLGFAVGRRGRRRYAISTFRPCRRRGRHLLEHPSSLLGSPLPGLRSSASTPRSSRRWSVRCAPPSSDQARPP